MNKCSRTNPDARPTNRFRNAFVIAVICSIFGHLVLAENEVDTALTPAEDVALVSGDSGLEDGDSDLFDVEDPEELILDKPHSVDELIAQTVKEEFTRVREDYAGPDEDRPSVWPALTARTERTAGALQASKEPQRADRLKASLLLPGSGGYAQGMLAVEGAHMAAALPEAESAHKSTQLAEQAQQEGDAQLAHIGAQVAEVARQIATGAVSQSGAFDNLPVEYTGTEDEDHTKVPYMMTSWLLALERAEINTKAASKNDPPEPFPNQEDRELEEWFLEKEASLYGLEAAEIKGKGGGMRGLVATQPIEEGALVAKVPIKACLTIQTANVIRVKGGFLGSLLKDVFAKNEEWGLANVLLYEHLRDYYMGEKETRYYPFTRTMRMYEPASVVMKELEGTYAAEYKREWEDEVEESYRYHTQKLWHMHPSVFQRNPLRFQAGTYTREDWRWALGVVRRRAIMVTRNATKLRFRALCPYIDLMPHKLSAGGEIVLHMDNHIHVTVGGAYSAGEQVMLNRGPYSDAETMFRFHTVDEEDNPNNNVMIKLPGVGGYAENIVVKVEKIRAWRADMQLPPRGADLWRASAELQLYGSEAELEEGLLPGQRQLGWPGKEDVELPPEMTAVQLYSANLFDFGEGGTHILASIAAKSLAKAATQLQTSVALDAMEQHTRNDSAIMEAISQAKNFFFYGIQPTKGLDQLDEVLIRKMELLEWCGDPKYHVITSFNISANLLCGIRVVLANTSDIHEFYDMDIIGMRHSIPSEDGGFNASLPISMDNERAVITALRDSVESLLSWYPTSIEEDESLLTLTTLRPMTRSAIRLRLREKVLLEHSLVLMDEWEEAMPNQTYQVELLHERAQRIVREAEEAVEREKERAERRKILLAPKEIATVPVDMGGPNGPVNLTIKEGDNLEAQLTQFVTKYGINENDKEVLRQEVKKRIAVPPILIAALSVVMEDGSQQYVYVKQGEQVESKIDEFVDMWGLDNLMREKLLAALKDRVEKRAKRAPLLELPLAASDGRQLYFHLKSGEQHDPVPLIRDFLSVWRQSPAAINQIANIINQRLPPARAYVRLEVGGGREVQIRISEGDDVLELAKAFVDAQGFSNPETVVPQVVRVLNNKLYPGSMQL